MLADRKVFDAQVGGTDRRPRSPVRPTHAVRANLVHGAPDTAKPQHRERLVSRNREHTPPDTQVLPSVLPREGYLQTDLASRYQQRQGKPSEVRPKVIVHLLRTKGCAALVRGWTQVLLNRNAKEGRNRSLAPNLSQPSNPHLTRPIGYYVSLALIFTAKWMVMAAFGPLY